METFFLGPIKDGGLFMGGGGGGLIEDFHQLRKVKYSQSYDFVCQMALLGGKGLSVALIKYNNIK